MTLAADPSRSADWQHLVLHDVTWQYYEHTLEQIGDGRARVTFLDGSIEIMSPLPEHEWLARAVAQLIRAVTLVRRIPMYALGSTTFRQDKKRAGLEPDECFYLQNESRVRGMKRFDPAVHPAPDLAIEVDITHRSLPRLPIYARLGVPEIWRLEENRLTVLRLGHDGQYSPVDHSPNFPFLPLDEFMKFALRMETEEQTSLLIEFQSWVRTLP